MRLTSLIALSSLVTAAAIAAVEEESIPVRGLAIAAPQASSVDRFVDLIAEELAPRGVNTLTLRVDFNYAYESHPELRSSNPLSREQVKQLVTACREQGIRLIPQINLLGHQSWAENVGKLLEVYPEFDETPHVAMPEKYEWPNPDGLYCKSYCPLHPNVHEVVFALVDEIMEAFEADAFHAGMDEVFYIGDDRCPRCSGRDKSELFAGEVTRIREHLAGRGWELWIWGDRLIDAELTGIGMWEASANDTHRAIDMIPKDVVICDWHYNRAEPTAALFALKGFRVVTCPWNRPEVALAQLDGYRGIQRRANPLLKERYRGLMHTYWSSAESFMDGLGGEAELSESQQGSIDCFKALFEAMDAAPSTGPQP